MKLLAALRVVFRFLLRLGIIALLTGVLILSLSELIINVSTHARIYPVDKVPSTRVAIVFGAGLTRNGGPSAVLSDRVEKAAELYKAGKVSKLLMSGDNRFVDYNEPAAMKSYAMKLGVPEKDIVLDYAGRRTYDTCYRAKFIFGVEEAILVTQSFHMPRALFTCNNIGLKSNGVPADVRTYGRRSYAYWYIREIPASIVAIWEVWISHPLPVLGKPEPIGN